MNASEAMTALRNQAATGGYLGKRRALDIVRALDQPPEVPWQWRRLIGVKCKMITTGSTYFAECTPQSVDHIGVHIPGYHLPWSSILYIEVL